MAKNNGKLLSTEENKAAGSDNLETNTAPEVEKSDELMTAAQDEAANVQDEKTADEKSEQKKDVKKKKLRKNKKSRKNKKKQNEGEKKENQDEKKENQDKKKPESSTGIKDDLAGLIFMCNSKTKEDCFRYHVFGLPKAQKDLVERVTKGMRLFLYDYELRLMYGIYKAKGRGGLDLARDAFKSSANRPFPAQVRFVIHKDCLPLPEDKFKVAIKDNYYGKAKRKFKFELNGQQVKKLCRLFRPIPRDGRQGNDSGFVAKPRREPYAETIPGRMAQHYPPLSEDLYALKSPDLYRSAYHRQPVPTYEAPLSFGNGLLSDVDYRGVELDPHRELIREQIRRERFMKENAFLDQMNRRIHVSRDADYGDSYLRRADTYPYGVGGTSSYPY